MPPLLQEKTSPLWWTLQCYCQISYIFPCQGCSTPAPSTSRLLPVRARGPHLKICLSIPDVGWLLQFSTFLKRDNAPSGQRTCPWCTPAAAAAPNTVKRIDCCKGRNGFCLKSLNSNCSVSFKEKRKKNNPFVAPKSSPGISDQHTCCYNYDRTAWLRDRGNVKPAHWHPSKHLRISKVELTPW